MSRVRNWVLGTACASFLWATGCGPDGGLARMEASLGALPTLAHQTRVPFTDCFKENTDNPFSKENLSNPTLAAVRDTISWDETYSQVQKLPIILVPGYLGTDHMNVVFTEMDYWYGIVDALKKVGFTQVTAAKLDAAGYSSDGPLGDSTLRYSRIKPVPNGYRGRGHQLVEIIEEVLNKTGAPKVNLIAHSQGALTARWVISNMGMADKVNALISLAGPHHGVPLTELAAGTQGLPLWLIDPVERIMDLFFGGLCESENSDAHGSHVEMWPTYMAEYFNPATSDMPGVKYVSVANKLNDLPGTKLSPYLLSPFWATHTLYAMKQFGIDSPGPDDGLVPVASSRGFDNGAWMYLGELLGKKVIPGTGIKSKIGVYWGVDHAGFMNFPLGLTKYFHFDAKTFFVDLARLLNAYSD